MNLPPGKREIDKGIYKLVNGVWHKRCNGRGHDEPTYLPASEKYFYVRKGWNEGSFVALCRMCHNWNKIADPGPDAGFIEISKIHHIYAEAVNRIGLQELSKRSGVGRRHIYMVLNYRLKYARKRNVKLILLQLISIKRKNEYSINTLSAWRLARRGNGHGATYCVGCGIFDMKEEPRYTEDCPQCDDRKRKRVKASTLTAA